jgi:hypothetical protein
MSQILQDLEDILELKFEILNRIKMRIESNDLTKNFGFTTEEIYSRSKMEIINKLFINLLKKINKYLIKNDPEIAKLPRDKLFTIDRIEIYMCSPTLKTIVNKYKYIFEIFIYDTYVEIQKFDNEINKSNK